MVLNPLVLLFGRLVALSGRKRGNRQTDRQTDGMTDQVLKDRSLERKDGSSRKTEGWDGLSPYIGPFHRPPYRAC